ncbi:putative tRNA-splicing endonuclease subunit sen2 [Penicillium argentinense]|uniref:tRNA-splicing endonuclease subunit Sen2 n=1 Tax=Penicillium argentinense TaxID=1131581 RepID=A0A9W9KBF2_9EURO|nr:putative tRNA-splicing endonuclease subunit sen2 [Penicillium argentinense]KAJ5099571.1 putative tRNA-splicing endonuclease subunit sen2 [Penicillium argentinense]
MAEVTSPAKASPAVGPEKANTRPARGSRPPRPNYKHIHRFPFPLNVQPVLLPPVIPHNPVSIISAVLSYLTFLISPPSQEIYSAYFDPATSSIHVTDERAIRALWERGFFGKGNLSRSEPSWLEREKKRRGLLGGQSSEEVTRKRRAERRELKLERARSERLLIEERLKVEAAARESGRATPSTDGVADATAITIEKFSVKKAMDAKYRESREARLRTAQNGEPVPAPDASSSANGKSVRFSSVAEEKEVTSTSTIPLQDSSSTYGDDVDADDIFENQEHLQISNEEAFFLVYGLGVLRVFDREQSSAIPASSLLPLLRRHSYFPPNDDSAKLEPDDPFMLSYVVYHHFRSLGWVVRSGVKFGTDYLLYNRGPVFSHAEFAVIIVPSYTHSYWSQTEKLKEYAAAKQARSWWWLHCVNRVQAQVKKSLVICYVEVPPPVDSSQDIGTLLGQYRVREFLLRRWIPNRTRD